MIVPILAAIAISQQGGGGAFGAAQGPYGSWEDDGAYATAQHILTPGDRSAFDIEVPDGTGVILKASSDVFDPAIQIEDEHGKKIAENDDEAQGMQSARLLYCFAKGGKYKVRVANYRGASGGPYTLRKREFKFADAKIGAQFFAKPLPEDASQFLRYDLKANVIYRIVGRDQTIGSFVGADGFAHANVPNVPLPEGGRLVRPEKDGAYLVEVKQFRRHDDKYDHDGVLVAPIVEEATTVDGPAIDAKFDYVRMHMRRLTMKAGDFLKLESSGPVTYTYLTLPAKKGDPAPAYQVIEASPKRPGDRYLLARTPVDMVYYCQGSVGGAYKLRVFHCSQDWNLDLDKQATLGLHEIAVWKFHADVGEIAQVTVSSNAFDAVTQWINPGGWEFLATDDQKVASGDGTAEFGSSSLIELIHSGAHYVVVRSLGYGGSGAYTLSAKKAVAAPIAVGETKKGVVDSPTSGVWTFNATKGQVLMLSIMEGREQVRLNSVQTPAYAPQPYETVNLPDRYLVYITAASDGVHRFRLRGEGAYSIRLEEWKP